MLRLLDALRPVYERQPAHRPAMKRWNEWRMQTSWSKPARARRC